MSGAGVHDVRMRRFTTLSTLAQRHGPRLLGWIATPLLAIAVAVWVYGGAVRLHNTVAEGTAVQGPYPIGYYNSAGTFHPPVALIHPNASALVGVFSALVLVGLVVCLLAGMLLVGRVGRRRPQGGAHVWTARHVANRRHVAVALTR